MSRTSRVSATRCSITRDSHIVARREIVKRQLVFTGGLKPRLEYCKLKVTYESAGNNLMGFRGVSGKHTQPGRSKGRSSVKGVGPAKMWRHVKNGSHRQRFVQQQRSSQRWSSWSTSCNKSRHTSQHKYKGFISESVAGETSMPFLCVV